jgi:putative ABC transport system ATP-binding protein
MIAGVYPLDAGTIELDGNDISRLPEHARARYLGRVFQDPMRGTAADMQIDENLALASRRGLRRTLRWGATRAERESYREALATLGLGLETRLSDKVGLLSGGQRQALTLLMATLKEPDLLLLDEHTAALDPATAAKVLELTRQIVEERKITCMMVTHNMEQALELGNRTLMMSDGRIVFDAAGSVRDGMTVEDLLRRFAEQAGKKLNNDRILLSTEEGK